MRRSLFAAALIAIAAVFPPNAANAAAGPKTYLLSVPVTIDSRMRITTAFTITCTIGTLSPTAGEPAWQSSSGPKATVPGRAGGVGESSGAGMGRESPNEVVLTSSTGTETAFACWTSIGGFTSGPLPAP